MLVILDIHTETIKGYMVLKKQGINTMINAPQVPNAEGIARTHTIQLSAGWGHFVLTARPAINLTNHQPVSL